MAINILAHTCSPPKGLMGLKRGKKIPDTVKPSTLGTSLYAAGGPPAGAANDTAGGLKHAVRRGVRMTARAKQSCAS